MVRSRYLTPQQAMAYICTKKKNQSIFYQSDLRSEKKNHLFKKQKFSIVIPGFGGEQHMAANVR